MDESVFKYKSLLELIKTTEDVVILDDEIDLVLQSVYHSDVINLEEILAKYTRVRVARVLSELIQLYTSSKKSEIKSVLKDAYRSVCSQSLLKLTLAFEPSEQAVNDMSYWARSNLEEGVILDLSLDRSLGGGALIMYKGKFYDYSIKRKLREIFERGDLII